MKTLLTAIAMVLVSQIAKSESEELRTWTEESTKRKIEARMVKKDDNKGTVTLMLKSTKRVNLDTSKLIEKDQEYIKGWSKSISPRDQLTVRIVKSGRSRGKRVEVEVQAGKLDVTLSGHNLSHTVKAGERKLFQVEVPDKYTFTLNDTDGNLIDQETALKKTGRTKSR